MYLPTWIQNKIYNYYYRQLKSPHNARELKDKYHQIVLLSEIKVDDLCSYCGIKWDQETDISTTRETIHPRWHIYEFLECHQCDGLILMSGILFKHNSSGWYSGDLITSDPLCEECGFSEDSDSDDSVGEDNWLNLP